MSQSTAQKWIEAGMPLSMEEKLILIRDKIRQNYFHKGDDKVLVKAAYNEIRNAQGKKELTLDCGSCIADINKNLMQWFIRRDNRTELQKNLCAKWHEKPGESLSNALSGTSDNGLITLDERRKALEESEYWDLTERAKKLPQASIDKLWVKGRPPKKEDIINEILNH